LWAKNGRTRQEAVSHSGECIHEGAEYLTLIVTSLLIPFELYELAIGPSLWKAGGLLVNVMIVVYLAVALRRRLAPVPR